MLYERLTLGSSVEGLKLLRTTLNKKVTLGLSSYQFMAMARRGLFYTFLSLYLMAGLGLSVTETTLLASLSMITNSLSQTFVWGKISDKYRIRASLVVVGETIAAVGYLSIYFLHIHLLNTMGSVAAGFSIIAGLTLLEFFWSMSNLGWSALLSDVTNSKERGTLMSVVSSIGGIGRIVGISVSGVLYNWGGDAGGFRSGILFLFPAGIMLASALLIWFSMRFSEQNHSSEQPDAASVEGTARPHSHGSRVFYWFLTSISIVGLGTHSILQILTFYVNLDSPIGATAFDIAMIGNSASATTIIFSLLAGPLADRIGRKRALSLGFGLSVLTPVFYIFAQSPLHMMIINSLSGMSTAIVTVVGYLMASDLIPAPRRGRLFGQYNAAISVSFGIAGTVIGGPIADYMIATGASNAAAYVATFQAASLISLFGMLMFVLKVRSRAPEDSAPTRDG